MKHFLRLSDFSKHEIENVLSLSIKLKKEIKKKGKNKPLFKDKSLAMIFEKPSLRTRVSFEVGMTQLGGHALYLGPHDIQMGRRETVADIAGTLCRYVDIIMARVFTHQTIVELSKHATVPVINALSDLEHPCQIMADLETMLEHKKKLKGLKVAFVGDGENNVTHSLAIAAGLLGIDFRVASPKGYRMKREVVTEAVHFAKKSGGKIIETASPRQAVDGVDVVYTDTWVSMGDEAEKEKRLRDFTGFGVTTSLMKYAKMDAVFMHDMPAYRGNEVSASVIDGPQSIIFDQAENRLHAQKGIMVFLLSQMKRR
jgi:ornithine carbamoyltransferase